MALAPRTILITGGTRGLGLATAKLFAKKSARLILTFRSDFQNAERVQQGFKKDGFDCHVVQNDLSEDGASDLLFDKVTVLSSSVDVYVHNAAATAFKPLLDMKAHHIRKTFNVTVTSFIQNVQRLVPLMKEGGSIISVSGLDTKQVVPLHGLLAGAKSALDTLTLYFAHELAQKNIRVNGVNPGYLETDSTQKNLGPLYEKAVTFIERITPGQRRAKLEDVASVIEFLASENSRWIVGQTIIVDGGQTFVSPASILMQLQSKIT